MPDGSQYLTASLADAKTVQQRPLWRGSVIIPLYEEIRP
jgi:hypothetical protein